MQGEDEEPATEKQWLFIPSQVEMGSVNSSSVEKDHHDLKAFKSDR